MRKQCGPPPYLPATLMAAYPLHRAARGRAQGSHRATRSEKSSGFEYRTTAPDAHLPGIRSDMCAEQGVDLCRKRKEPE